MKILSFAFNLIVATVASTSFTDAIPSGKKFSTPAVKTVPIHSTTKEVIPSFECPSNYEKQGNLCIQSITVKPKVVCPRGFTTLPIGKQGGGRRNGGWGGDNNINRRHRNRLERNLRKSFDYDYIEDYSEYSDYDYYDEEYSKTETRNDDVKCINVHTIDPTHRCSGDGYELDGNDTCLKHTESSPTLKCSTADYKLVGNECVRTTIHNPTQSCLDPSFTMIGDKCARVVGTAPMEGCTSGYMLENDKCVKIDRMRPFAVCPPRTIPNPLNSETCLEHVVINGSPTCPQGFKMTGDSCVKQEIFTPEKHCEGDASLLGPECITEVILDAAYKCPDGFTKDPSGFCIMKKEPEPFCVDGTLNRETQRCESKQSILPAIECPRGWEFAEDGESCIKTDKVSIEYSCPRGYEVKGSECIFKEEVLPESQCPEGFTLVEGKCIRPLYKKKWQQCQKGFELVGDRCVTSEEIIPSFVCPDGFELKLNKCVQSHSVPPSESCPSGTTLKDNKCIKTEKKKPENECENSYVYNEETRLCEEEEVVPVNYKCPRDFVEIKGKCIKTEKIEAIPRCPDNHHYDKTTANCIKNHSYEYGKASHFSEASWTPVVEPSKQNIYGPTTTHTTTTILSNKNANTATTYLSEPYELSYEYSHEPSRHFDTYSHPTSFYYAEDNKHWMS